MHWRRLFFRNIYQFASFLYPVDRTQGFYLDVGSAKLHERFAMIPDDTEYLVTHSPPKAICDVNGKGSALLRDRVEDLARLRVMQFGHVHNVSESSYDLHRRLGGSFL